MTSQSITQSPMDSPSKEPNQFFLNNDYFKTLILYKLDLSELDTKLAESTIKETFKSNEKLNNVIQNVFILYGNKSLLIVCKESSDLNQVEKLIEAEVVLKGTKLTRQPLPGTLGSSIPPILITSEINDSQLNLISEEKYASIKTIEARTGLKLKKIKKSIYFSGLLFQFNILNELLNECYTEKKGSLNLEEAAEVATESSKPLPVEEAKETDESPVIFTEKEDKPLEKPCHDWNNLYTESQIRYNFKLKPKLLDLKPNTKSSSIDLVPVNSAVNLNPVNDSLRNFEYDVYIFHADLTELNTDGLVNATNTNLHPGYDGDGIARRIREKSGKQLVDACKRILKQDRNGSVLNDSECVHTKAYGRLKAKYVLHTVAPTWTKYILNGTSSISDGSENLESKFEPLLEQTFTNLMKLAHDPKLKIDSIAFPMASNSSGE